jgi:DNA-binding NarL/FixJ family response regulator
MGRRGRAGADQQPDQDADHRTLVRAIRAVAQGEALLGLSVARRVLEQFNAPTPAAPTPPVALRLAPELFGELTPRELGVLRLIAQGLRNRDIAERLVIRSNCAEHMLTRGHPLDRLDQLAE